MNEDYERKLAAANYKISNPWDQKSVELVDQFEKELKALVSNH